MNYNAQNSKFQPPNLSFFDQGEKRKLLENIILDNEMKIRVYAQHGGCTLKPFAALITHLSYPPWTFNHLFK